MDYREIENSLLDILITIKDRLVILDAPEDLLEKTATAIECINTKNYQIAVVGPFKIGKSSLINGLLGSNILPADVVPATATINRIVFGKELSATAFFHDGGSEKISINQLSEYVTKITESGAAQAEKIKEVVITTPTPLCQNHIQIIDTPGLNDDKSMTRITMRLIEDVDAVIVPIPCSIPFDDFTCDFVCSLIRKETIDNIIFVATKMDELDEDDCSYEDYVYQLKKRITTNVLARLENEPDMLERAHGFVDEDKMHLFAVSSSWWLNDVKRRKESHFAEFSDKLLPIVTAKQMDSAIRKAEKQITEIMEKSKDLSGQKETAFNKKLDELSRIPKILSAYEKKSQNEIIKLFEKDQENIKILKEINGYLNPLKNAFVKKYIQVLSQVKQSDTEEQIRKLLRNVDNEISDMMNTEVKKSLSETFMKLLDPIGQKMQKFRSEELHLLIDYGFLQENNVTLEKTFSSCIGNKLDFFWQGILVSERFNLLQMEVINELIEQIDLSVETYKKNISEIYHDCTVKCDWVLRTETNNAIIHDIEKKIEAEKNRISEEQITFKNNFSMFIDDLPVIQNRVNEIIKAMECL